MAGPGKKTTRRGALAGAGGISLAALLAACGGDKQPTAAATATPRPAATPEAGSRSPGLAARFDAAATCAQTAEQTEGPFYFDVDRIRRDITEDRDGTPLRVGVRVRDAAACEPIESAVVDIWHCDAAGGYSGFEGQEGETYLRGAQVTDAEGIAVFDTIYPGGYTGRTPHIHAKVHLDKTTVLTTQLYFADEVSARVYATGPYARGSDRDTGNAADGIYDRSLELTLSEEGDGWLGLMTIDVRRA